MSVEQFFDLTRSVLLFLSGPGQYLRYIRKHHPRYLTLPVKPHSSIATNTITNSASAARFHLAHVAFAREDDRPL